VPSPDTCATYANALAQLEWASKQEASGSGSGSGSASNSSDIYGQWGEMLFHESSGSGSGSGSGMDMTIGGIFKMVTQEEFETADFNGWCRCASAAARVC
jgi:hypothetical protein